MIAVFGPGLLWRWGWDVNVLGWRGSCSGSALAWQVASGCNFIFFTTGNGSITNFPFVPTVKVGAVGWRRAARGSPCVCRDGDVLLCLYCARASLLLQVLTTTGRFKMLSEDMDFNAGAYQDGVPMADLTQQLLLKSVEHASGSLTVGENAGHSQVRQPRHLWTLHPVWWF